MKSILKKRANLFIFESDNGLPSKENCRFSAITKIILI